MIKGYIFDLDGTLLDSMKVWDVLSIHYLESLGITPDNDLVGQLQTLSLDEAAIYIQKEYNLDISLEKMKTAFIKQLEKEYQSVTLKPGVKDFLEKCSKKNIKMCVLTANHQYITENVLKRLKINHYFHQILSCEDIGYTKKDIQSYQYVVESIGLSQNECVVVEDALHAAMTAKKAGFYVKVISDETNLKDWDQLCEVANQNYQTFEGMEVAL